MSLFSSHNLILEKVVQDPAPQVDVHEVLSTVPTQGQTIALASIILSPRATAEGCRKRQGRDFSPLLLCLCVCQNRTLHVSFLPLMSSLPPSPALLPRGLSSWTWVASLGLCLSAAFGSLSTVSHFQWAAYLNQRPQLLLGGPFAPWEPVSLGSGDLFVYSLAISEW